MPPNKTGYLFCESKFNDYLCNRKISKTWENEVSKISKTWENGKLTLDIR